MLQQRELHSVRDHGFGVGARAQVAPSDWPDEATPRNPVVVRGVEVNEERGRFFGSEVETLHDRKIEDADGREWTVGVGSLRAI